MNARTMLLGIAAFLSLCSAIALQFLYINQTLVLSAWALTATLIIGWLALNQRLVGSFLTRKSTRYGANLALVIFLVLGILTFLNVLVTQHNWRRDITRSGVNTLGPQTEKVLGGLVQDVKIYFFTSLNEKDKGDDLFKRYAYLSKKIKYEFVDVDRRPTLAEAMGVKRKGATVLVLGDSGKKVIVDTPTEEQVTNGLIKLLRSGEVAIYFTVGHDEHALEGEADPLSYASLKAELVKQGYGVKELNLFSEGKIPADAAVVIVGGPRKAFFPKELEILSEWMREGGHTALAVDLDVAEDGLAKGSRQVAELLKPYGIEVMSQMLVDPTSKAANVEPQVLLGFSGSKEHPITRDFAHSASVANFLFPMTTYLTHGESDTFQITPLAVTTSQAWAESDWGSLKSGRVSFDPAKDHKGPMDLAYAVERKAPAGQKAPGDKKALKLAVFADALFATSNLLDKVGNRDLALNAVAWLADDDRFISIRPKDDPDGLRQFNSGTINVILLFTVFLFPLLMIAAGVVVWWRRSKL